MVHRTVEGNVIAVAQDEIEGLTERAIRSIWPPIPTSDEPIHHIAALAERLRRDAGRAVPFDALCSAIWPDKPWRATAHSLRQLIISSDDDLLVLHPWRGVRILCPAEYLDVA